MGDLKKRSRFNIFISHNHNDNSFGHRLVEDLRHVLNEDDNVWYDSKSGRYNSNGGLRAGDNWQRVINQKISRCNVFIVLLSKKAIRSGWVKFELELVIPRTIIGRVRIIPIRLDDCKMPIELVNRYQIIEYRSQDDYKTTIDELLKGLGLPPYPANQDSSIAHYTIRWANTAFDSEEWQNAVDRLSSIINRFQEFTSSSTYFKLAIALLKLGEIQQSKLAIEKGLLCEMKEESDKLLQKYVGYLIDKEKWDLVLYCSDLLISKEYNKKYWQEVKNYVIKHKFHSNNSILKSSISKCFTENGVFTNSGFTETTTDFKDGESIPSTFSSEGFLPQTNPGMEEEATYTLPEMDEMNSDECVEPEISSTVAIAKNIALHLSAKSTQRVFGSSSSFLAGVFNAAGFIIVASRSHFSHISIWFVAILLFTIFLFGRTTKNDFLGFVLSICIAVFWCFIGYNIGNIFITIFNNFDITLDKQISYCINVISTLSCSFYGFSSHRYLFSIQHNI